MLRLSSLHLGKRACFKLAHKYSAWYDIKSLTLNAAEGNDLQLLYCDESNLQEHAGDFLIYGGVLIDADQAPALSMEIDELRQRRNVPNDYQMKFNPGPDNQTHQDFVALKQEFLQISIRHGAQLLVYVILHDIATDPDTARRFGINTVCSNFQIILENDDEYGFVLIDRFNDAGNRVDQHLRDKFSIGIKLPDGRTQRLSRILGFHYSAIGQSHFSSLVDIALGSLRFAINAHTRNDADKQETATRLLEILAPMFWRQPDREQVPEIGFQFSPRTVNQPRYWERYQALKTFLAEGGIDVQQDIPNPIDQIFRPLR